MTPAALRDPLPHAHTVTVFGMGWTGVVACRLLSRLGKRVIGTDTRDLHTLRRALDGLRQTQGVALPEDIALRCGDHAHHGADALVLTQSVKPHEAPVQAALRLGIPVIPEVELAARALNPDLLDLVAIGGTDGKTTTTKLAFHLASHQRRAYVGGNSWPPLSQVLLHAADDLHQDPLPPGSPRAALIAEISAFQIPPWHRFSPLSVAITNVAEDHLDEYFQGSMAAYTAAKRGPTDHLGPGQCAALNIDDPLVRLWQPDIEARGATLIRTTLAARAAAEHPAAAYRHNGELRLRWQGAEVGLIHQDALPLVGDHNVENTLSAAGALLPLGLDTDLMRRALTTFEAPSHRLQHIATLKGIDVYDDSKATNVHAALAGLAAFGPRPLVAIVGGVDKGLALDHWVEALRARARHVVVIGELRERLFRDHGHRLPQATAADGLDDAIDKALRAAQPGDVLILSPACSSFDMFDSYAQRGDLFQQAIRDRL